MIQYQEVLANATMRFIETLRRLELAETPIMTKDDTSEVFTVWKFVAQYMRTL
jgi:hypothetical protein